MIVDWVISSRTRVWAGKNAHCCKRAGNIVTEGVSENILDYYFYESIARNY